MGIIYLEIQLYQGSASVPLLASLVKNSYLEALDDINAFLSELLLVMEFITATESNLGQLGFLPFVLRYQGSYFMYMCVYFYYCISYYVLLYYRQTDRHKMDSARASPSVAPPGWPASFS